MKAIDRIHRQIELQAKLIGELDERPQVNVLLAPERMSFQHTLLLVLGRYPEARQAVIAELIALETSQHPHGTAH